VKEVGGAQNEIWKNNTKVIPKREFAMKYGGHCRQLFNIKAAYVYR
jgi:hypothetical protein